MKKIAIVGGGIVGLATGYKLQKLIPTAKITLFEKEDSEHELMSVTFNSNEKSF